jgi:BirA family biotin operon repressor/biotin-[acetyl-CoA-carboxylase] ligase
MISHFSNSRPLKLGEHLIKLESVDSTNNFANNLIRKENPVEGTVILAGYQTMGKGQGGSKWVSDSTQNLLFSIILRPDFLKAERQFYLSMCISNGLAALIEGKVGESQIKWPNDILVRSKKLAGILIENTVMKDMLYTSVVGIGLNVNQSVFGPGLPDAVSLSLISGIEYNLTDLLNNLLGSISDALEPLYAGNPGIIKTNYLNRLYRLNEWSRFTDENGIFEGRITDVAGTGELIVSRHNGATREYGFKEISFS